MRPIVLLLLALFGFVAVLAKKDDVACVVHSDDCGKCVSHGCNWCSDGYCVSAESDICEASKVATTCEAKILDKHQARQDRPDCESYTTCAACAAATECQVCVDADTKLFKCSSNEACTAASYALSYEWWIPATGLKGLSFTAAACPTPAPIGANAPQIALILSVYLFGTEVSCDGLQTSFPIGKILALLQGILTSQQYDATFIAITSCSVTASKRQTILPDLYNANLIAKLGDNGAISGQGVAATVISADPTITAAPGTTITVTPYLPGSGTSGQAIGSGSSGSKKNNNTSLSKGALAGIIIGCIVFGAILVALIVWLVLRKRDSYPQAFRSPAAAYRP